MSNGYPPQGGQGGNQPPPGGGYPPQGGGYPQQQQGQPQYPQQQPYGQPQQQQQYPGGYQQYPQGQSQYQSGPSGPRANFGQRLVGYLIDTIIVLIPLFIIDGILGTSLFSFEFTVNESTGELGGGGGASAGAELLSFLLSIAIPLAYYGYFEGGDSGQTIGKKAMAIRVIRQQDGRPLGWGLAIGRYFAHILSAIVCLLGYFWMIWDNERQTWHDKLASTLVVPTSAYPIQPPGGQVQGGYNQGGYNQYG